MKKEDVVEIIERICWGECDGGAVQDADVAADEILKLLDKNLSAESITETKPASVLQKTKEGKVISITGANKNMLSFALKLGINLTGISDIEQLKKAISEKIEKNTFPYIPPKYAPTKQQAQEILADKPKDAYDKSIYDDVYFFCTQGEMKRLHQVTTKLTEYGLSYKIIKDGEYMHAFDVAGKFRMPEKGFLRFE